MIDTFVLVVIAVALLVLLLCALTYTCVKPPPDNPPRDVGPHLPADLEDTQEMPPVDPEATEPVRWWWN